jgi:mannose-6-phosphate isomerase-like protein (cupin superfamily)
MNNYQAGAKDTRPWGEWRVTDAGEGFCVKRICVNAGGILSLQRHKFRAEHWTIVAGTAFVTLGKKIKKLVRDESIYIPVNEWHRIENRGTEQLEFIEVQIGDKLDENDIERRDDKYGRK